MPHIKSRNTNVRVVFTWLSKGIGFGFGFGFTTPFGWLVYLLWFWFYDSQVKAALFHSVFDQGADLAIALSEAVFVTAVRGCIPDPEMVFHQTLLNKSF